MLPFPGFVAVFGAIAVSAGSPTTVNVTALLVPPKVVTVTVLAVSPAVAGIVKVAVTDAGLTAVMLAVTPVPDTVTAVAPVRLVPPRVTGMLAPCAP